MRRFFSIEPVGILNAWTMNVRMNRARMKATTMDSRYSRTADLAGGAPEAVLFIAWTILAGLFVHAQHGQEGLLGNVHAAHTFHPLLPLLLPVQELAFAADVAAVTLGGDVLPQRLHSLPGDHPRADGGLDGHLEHLPGDHLPHLLDQRLAPGVGGVPVDDQRQGVYGVAVHEDVELHQG